MRSRLDEMETSSLTCQVIDLGLIQYEAALSLQRELVVKRQASQIPDTLLLLEHPHVITLGRSGNFDHLLATQKELQMRNVEFHETDRGGDITYHGPGQLVIYPIFDLKSWHKDIHLFLRTLEDCIIQVLKGYDITGSRRAGATGVWVGDEKIAAIGVRTSQWVTSHGLAFNINPDLKYFDLIIPCGIRDTRVTSLKKLLGINTPMEEVKERLMKAFGLFFGRTVLREFSCVRNFTR
jgi:lipoyl(octanoyl) transferase